MAKKTTFISPLIVFFLYTGAAFAGICLFRFMFPPPATIGILEHFRFSWRFIGGIISFIHLFPALVFSALVIPFGLNEHTDGGYAGSTFIGKKGFSIVFLDYLFWPVITAAIAAVTYSLLFFLALPLAMNLRNSILDRSELFYRARAGAELMVQEQQWAEAALFIDICDGIWPENRDIERLKMQYSDLLMVYRRSLAAASDTSVDTAMILQWMQGEPMDSAEAFRLAEEAFNSEQFFDAHWLANMAQRLARPGSAEITPAARLASMAWDRIADLEPNAQEREQHLLFRMKRDAYEAMNAGDFIGAFYAFQELSVLTPNDPDITRYLELSREGLVHTAFFYDELNMAIGTNINGAVFSLPDQFGGRMALHFKTLTLLRDHAYIWGMEVIAADSEGRFRFRLEADYAKMIPVSMNDNEGNPADRVVLLLRALDRSDRTRDSEPVWTINEEFNTNGTFTESPFIEANQLMLSISYNDFLLLSRTRQGKEILNLRDLFTAEKAFGEFGYIQEGFWAEILRRLGEVVFFLPFTVLALILGWRYRARKKPRYVYLPMLIILPVVFYSIVQFYRNIITNFSVFLSLSMGLSAALVCLTVFAVVFFILALVLLAAQHG